MKWFQNPNLFNPTVTETIKENNYFGFFNFHYQKKEIYENFQNPDYVDHTANSIKIFVSLISIIKNSLQTNSHQKMSSLGN